MTMWANVVHGIGFGRTGVIISGWPPVALIAAVEVLARMIRPSPGPGALAAGNGAPAHLIEAQRKFADEIVEHKVPTIRQIRSGLSVGAARAAEAQKHIAVLAENGEREGGHQ